MSLSLYETLKAAKIGSGAAPDFYTALMAQTMPFSKGVYQLSGVPPLEFTANGQPLVDWSIFGNMQQSGTPTPSNPIYPSECGDLVTESEHAGQHKIAISCGGTTTPVYLGEVQSTRWIKKLVLTGEENDWIKASGYNVFANTSITSDCYNPSGIITCMCSHYAAQGNVSGARLVNDSRCCFRTTTTTLYIGDNTHTDLESFLTYLQQQYTNGTPVTIWYVLANETTGIVNEPIRKIGDFADKVSDTEIIIPTIKGNNTLSVDTALQPSRADIKYRK